MSPARAHRRRPPVSRLRRAPAGVPRGRAARRRRHRPAARQGARRRRAGGAPREEFRAAADAHGALFILNDRPDLVAACGADGVHVGQDDGTVAAARAARRAGPHRRPLDARAGAGRRRGRRSRTSTTSRSGRCTPRRPSRAGPRPASTTSRWAAAHVATPWFAIGGLDAGNVGAVDGARRARASSSCARSPTAADPEAAARALRARAGGARWGSAAVSRGRAGRGRAMARGYARGRARDEACARRWSRSRRASARSRSTLAACSPPRWPCSTSCCFAAGWEVRGAGSRRPSASSSSPALMLAAAAGMWQCRYWAVLGFEALLGIALLWPRSACSWPRTSVAVALCLGMIAVAGPLFWFLIRAMARIQLPFAPAAGARRLASSATMPESATTASSSDPGRAGTWRRSARPSSA